MATTVDFTRAVNRGADFIENLYQKPEVLKQDPLASLFGARVDVNNAITKHYQNAWWHVSFNEENAWYTKVAKFALHFFTLGTIAFVARVILADTKPSVQSVLEKDFSTLKQGDTTLKNLSEKVKTYKKLSEPIRNDLCNTKNPYNKLVGHIIEAIKPEGFNESIQVKF
ncbi:MAG: hypothetical protein KDK76_04280 [Chlamydiia bacterium]|nr:hypothetical protein [Chlamydiia bacterium]